MAIVSDKKPFIFEKQPAEKEIIGVDFSRRIPTGVSISAYAVVATLYDNSAEALANTLGPHLQATSSAVTNKKLSCLLIDGVDGFKYKVVFTVTLSDNQVKEEDVYVNVIEK